jgi:hypothetical protein
MLLRRILERQDCGGTDRIYLAQNKEKLRVLVKAVMKLRVQWNAGKFLSGCTADGLSRRPQLHGARVLVCI